MSETHFSTSYDEARRRFREAAAVAGATLCEYPIGKRIANGQALTIDIAVLGPEGAPTLVTSSGVHGVEGFLGSAIQLAWLAAR